MANTCYNIANIYHNDPEVLKASKEAIANNTFLETFVPMPTALQAAFDAANDETLTETEREQLTAALHAEFGYANEVYWYNCNWGTKWVTTTSVGDADGGIRWEFDSAWAPPLEAYNALLEQGFSIDACYLEPGMMFCGVYYDGAAEDYEISSTDPEWMNENLPDSIVNEFNLAEFFSEDVV